MTKTKKLLFLLGSLVIFWYLVVVLAFNIWLPRKYHFAVYAASEKITEELPLALKFLTFRYLSGFMFRYTGNYCDFPGTFYGIDVVDAGENMTVGVLVTASSYPDFPDSNIVYAELERALTKCDPNIVSEGQPPIFRAITDINEKTVSILLKHNVDLNIRSNNSGFISHQRTPAEYAKRLSEHKDTSEQEKIALKNIIAMLESHIQNDSSVSSKPAISEIVSP